MTKHDIERFAALFAGLDRHHGAFSNDNPTLKRGKVEIPHWRVSEPVTQDLYEKHLFGRQGLAIVPIRDDATCVFGCIDIDVRDEKGNYIALDLAEVATRVNKLQLPLIVCRSKSGGAHCFLFLSEAVDAGVVRQKLHDWAIVIGYPKVEVFPKHGKLASESDLSSPISLPYFGAAETTPTRYAVLPSGAVDIKTFLNKAEESRLSHEQLVSAIAGIDEATMVEFDDAPPCIQYLAFNGIPQGHRNNALFNFGVYARQKHGDNWKDRLEDYNRQIAEPPIPASELHAIINSLEKKKEYFYTCEQEPMASGCHKPTCKRRKHGVGGGKGDPGVTIESLQKIATDPPTWIVSVNGKNVELMDTAELLSQSKFNILCVNALNILPKTIKADAWSEVVNELLAKGEVIEAPAEASSSGQLIDKVIEFCTGNVRGKDKSEVRIGKPYRDEEHGKIYFRPSALFQWLDRQGFRRMPVQHAYSIMRKAGIHDVHLGAKYGRAWALPLTDSGLPDVDFGYRDVSGSDLDI